MTDFDYIIVGAGSAGCVLANRLSANPHNTVLLVESGGRDRSPLIKMPKGFGKMLGNPKLTWHYPVRPIGPSANVEQWVRGRTLGGSSSVNGMVYNRGSAADWDALVELGNPGWGWDAMLPIFRRHREPSTRRRPDPRSRRPAAHLRRRRPSPALQRTHRVRCQIGLVPTDDMNATDAERIGPAARTIKNGQRVSSARAFLHPIAHRANLTVAVDTTVRRVVFEGDKAVGIEASTAAGTSTQYTAGREVILSLGSLATPKLLQLSGIGDQSLLRGMGIDTIVDSPNVGRRMQEHRCFALQFRINKNIGYNKQLSTPLRQAFTGAKYLVTKSGPLAGAAYDIIGFGKTSAELERPDAQLLLSPFSVAPYVAGKEIGLEREPGVQAIGYILRPDSEGSVTITSADPDAPLDIDPQFFTAPHDRETGVAIFHMMRRLFRESPIADYLVSETRPGSDVVSDEAIIDAALDDGYCGYHAVGTCAMGPAAEDVVDSSLRVRGVDGLRIMDCSVMPTMVSGNLNGPAMAMAWHAADLIAADG